MILAATALPAARRSARAVTALMLAGIACIAMPVASAHAQQAGGAKAAKPASKSASTEKPSRGSGQAIVVLVNDEPITAYEIEQRQRFMGLQANIGERVQANFKALLQRPETTDQLKAILNDTIKANQGKSKEQIIAIFEERKKQFALQLQKQAIDNARSSVLPGLRKTAVEELIDERLKLQEAKRVNVVASDDDVEKLIKSIAERNKMTVDQFAKNMASMGGDIGAMRARFKATLSWNDVIRRKFGHQIAITERDIDRAVSAAPGGPGEDQVDLAVQRITLPLGGAKIDQKNVAQRLQEAEAARAKFNGCKSTVTVANALSGAKFEDLGTRKPSSIPEPTRSMLLSAKDGEMLPASVGQGGVELWAVCSRSVVKADEAKREAVQGDLRQKEFEILAKKHLKDLRQDASIEWR